MQQIPVPDMNDSLLEIELEGVSFYLHFAWNSETSSWTLGLENVNESVVAEGIALVPNYPLLKSTRKFGYPPGELMVVRLDRLNDVGYDDLVQGLAPLVYIPRAEMP